MGLRKEYEGILTLGEATDTLDPTGKIIAEKPVPSLKDKQILAVFRELTGTIQQKIPDFSAAKIKGKRSYVLARKGVKLPDRYKTVKIYNIRLLNYQPTRIHFCVECGQGTYIRSLGYDIAYKLGTIGYLVKLIRNCIGDFHIKKSLSLDEFEQQWRIENRYENN
jgi:tRNA pseudouridine55 synthase